MSEWIEWNGGKMPVAVNEHVQVYINGEGPYIRIAQDVDWHGINTHKSVTSYRIYEDGPVIPASALDTQIGERDPSGIDAHAPGAKLDAGKTRVWLCIAGFSNALNAVAAVTTKGAEKYTPNGWAKVKDGEARYLDAFGRHALSLGRGELIDADTGCMHKAQMIWNLLASLELELRTAIEFESRSKK